MDSSAGISGIRTSDIQVLLEDHCGTIFPPYFRTIYEIIGKIKLCQNGLQRFNTLMDSLEDLSTIALEGLGLLMPHILAILGDAEPFKITKSNRNRNNIRTDIKTESTNNTKTESTNNNCLNKNSANRSGRTKGSDSYILHKKFRLEDVPKDVSKATGSSNLSFDIAMTLIDDYAAVIDVLGSRLGVRGTY